MTRARARREFAPGGSILHRWLQFFALAVGAALLLATAAIVLAWKQQAVFGLVLLVVAWWTARRSKSPAATLALVLLSCLSTLRYAFWRVLTVSAYLANAGTARHDLNAFFVLLLLAAEAYAFVVLILGYLQTAWPLHRAPAALPGDTQLWPDVDLLIPTVDEPLSVVRLTVLAALQVDWPHDRLHIHILDDGGRDEFRAFAQHAGVGYISREDHAHAKAGNLNHALKRLKSPFVAIFDADETHSRSFLQITVGWFLRDAGLGMLQTPQPLRSPDPFERNLGLFHAIPGENNFFYGAVQDGNDLWNATLFCGSCAVMRRAALIDVGGIATETVTEDVHTSLRMAMRGWRTAYINLPQAAGLAPERLADFVRQRVRWATGMVHIFRIDNPLLAPGLSFAQRLCYLNAMLHFLFALPRLIFLSAPLVYLILGRTALPGSWAAILAYAVPHLLLATVANSRIGGRYRYSFWNEIYETLLAPFLLIPTTLALLSLKSGKFNVTPKGGVLSQSFFDSRTALPLFLLLLLNVMGLLCAIPRAIRLPVHHLHRLAPFLGRMHDASHPGALALNVLWTIFNIVILGVAVSAARERRQRRGAVRIPLTAAAAVILTNSGAAEAAMEDVSLTGVKLTKAPRRTARAGDAIRVILSAARNGIPLPATVIAADGDVLRARFDLLSLSEEEALTAALYSRADRWLGWGAAMEADQPLVSLWQVIRLSARGLLRILRDAFSRREARAGLATDATVLLMILGLGFALSGMPLRAQTPAAPSPPATVPLQAGSDLQTTPDDLKLLPLPFYNPATDLQPSIPVVFLQPPSHTSLQAAGIVASWFGILAGRHPVRFTVILGTIPRGNAIVISENSALLPTDWKLANTTGPAIAIRTNPSDPSAKLLVLTGNTAADLLIATKVLALHFTQLAGATEGVTLDSPPNGREPDDAPRWLSTGRLTPLRELSQPSEARDGIHAPLQFDMPLPPGLFYGEAQNLLLHLKYRYNGAPLGDGSALQVYVNGAYVSSTPMPHTDGTSADLSVVVPLPVVDLRPPFNSLEIQFAFHVRNGSCCASAGAESLRAAVLGSPWLDLRGIPHWAALPDLALFAAAGYPFTRLADLSGSAVVLPVAPDANEIELFLALMGHFGAQTGYPVLHLEVTDAAGLAPGKKDYLVLGTAADSPAFGRLNNTLPVRVEPDGLHTQGITDIPHASGLNELRRWWRKARGVRAGQAGDERGGFSIRGGFPDAVIEGAEWPRGSGRSVVVVALHDRALTRNFLDAFLDPEQRAAISQSVSILRGPKFSSDRVGEAVYHVGSLPLWTRARLLAVEYPWLLALAAAWLCFLLAVVLESALRRHARHRLDAMKPMRVSDGLDEDL